MRKNLFKWVIYSIVFGILLSPLMIHYGLTSFWEIVSISFSVGFFAGILNGISSELKSIKVKLKQIYKVNNNQLRGKS